MSTVADIYSLFASPDDATAEEQAAALQAVLRRKSDLGMLAQLTGDRVLSPLGQSLQEQAAGGERTLATAGGQRLQRALQAQREGREKAAQDRELAQGDRRLGIEAQRAAAENWQPVQTGQGIYQLNKKTGEMRQVVGPDDKPVASKGAPGAGGLSDKDANNEFLKFGDAISSVHGRNSLLPKYQSMMDRAGRIRALAQLPDGTVLNATPQQVRELSTALAAMINGGNGAGAVSQIEELTPQTLAGKWANLKQKYLNEPTGADAQAFIKQMLESAAREEDQARQQLRSGQIKSIPAFANLRKRDRPRFDSMLKGEGLDPSTIDDNGLLVQAAQQAAAGDHAEEIRKAQAWLAANPGHPKADQVRQKIAALQGGG